MDFVIQHWFVSCWIIIGGFVSQICYRIAHDAQRKTGQVWVPDFGKTILTHLNNIVIWPAILLIWFHIWRQQRRLRIQRELSEREWMKKVDLPAGRHAHEQDQRADPGSDTFRWVKPGDKVKSRKPDKPSPNNVSGEELPSWAKPAPDKSKETK